MRRTIFEEGIAVPPVKIIRGGQLQDDVLKIILHNCRLPNWNCSDFNAIVAALRTAARRCVEICAPLRRRHVLFRDGRHARAQQARDAQLIRRTMPEKKQYFEDYVCDDGMDMGPYKIACTMWREGDKCIFDFAGTDPQSITSINFLLNENMFKMFFGIYMIMVFDPQILFNDGFYDLIEVRIPEGSLLKPLKPAALSCRTHALGRIFDVLGGLLGQGNPEFLCAAGFSDSPHFMYSGYDQERRVVPALPDRLRRHSRASRSATGPTAIRCGPRSPTCRTSSSRATSRCASRPTRRSPTPAAPGKFRGGNGIRIGYRFLEPGEISIHDDRWLTYPWGVNGGLPGARSRKLLVRADGSEELLPSKTDRVKVEPGDLLLYETWGGGGWGDPLERDPAKVAFDVEAGLVSEDGARRYGVVMKSGTRGRRGDEIAARRDGGEARRGCPLRSRLPRHRRAQVALQGGDRARAAGRAAVPVARAGQRTAQLQAGPDATMQRQGEHAVRAVDRAYDAVRTGIIAGRYLAGARLTEQEIATAVGVSRTPVREALRRLDAEGLVEFTPNLGAVVTVWSEADSDEVFDLRAMLESYSARRATLRATPEQIAELKRLAETQHRESVERKAGHLERIAELNSQFHRRLQEAAASARLSRALAALIEAPLMMRTFQKYTPEDLERSSRHHLEIVRALEARDPDWAASVMLSHIHAARGALNRLT